MSLIQDIASFAKKLFTLEKQVDINAEEIKLLRQEMNELQGLTRNLLQL